MNSQQSFSHIQKIIFLLFLPGLSLASSRNTCSFKVKIISIEAERFHMEKLSFIKSDGTQIFSQLYCSKLFEKTLLLKNINSGKELIKKNATLKAIKVSYSSMGPKGPISGQFWRLEK